MSAYDSAALVAAFQLKARFPTQGLPPLTTADIYQLLTEAQEEVYTDLAQHAPHALMGAPTLLTSTDGGVTYTFGTDGDGDPVSPLAVEVYAQVDGRTLYACTYGNAVGDFVIEGTRIRGPGNRSRIYSVGPFARFITPPGPISASAPPTLSPKRLRKLLVLKALIKYANIDGRRDPRPYEEEYDDVWLGRVQPGGWRGGGERDALKLQFETGMNPAIEGLGPQVWWLGLTGSGTTTVAPSPATTGGLPVFDVTAAPYANGDASTATTAAMTAAIAAGGGIVYYPAGTYVFQTPIVVAGSLVAFAGAGAGRSILRAAPGTTFQDLFAATDRLFLTFADLTLDVNGANRSAAPGVLEAIRLVRCHDSLVQRCEITGALGSATNMSAAAVSVSETQRVRVADCYLRDCGAMGRASDGVYLGTCTHSLITGLIATAVTDTAAVLESCSYSGIETFTIGAGGCGVAVSNASTVDVWGNWVANGTINDWNAAVVGGLQVAALSFGNLRNTRIDGVTLRRIGGAGPAINARASGTGRIIGLSINAPFVDGASTQGILAHGDHITVSTPDIRNCVASAIQFVAGSTACMVFGGFIESPSVGVLFDTVTTGRVLGTQIEGAGGTMTYGIFVTGASSDIQVSGGTEVSGATVARVGTSGGTTPFVTLAYPSAAGGYLFGGAGDTNLYRAVNSPDLTTDNDLRAAGGFRSTIGPFTQDNVTAGQTNVALSGVRWVAPRAGSVTAVVVKSTEARTAGTCTVEVWKNTGLSGAVGATIGLPAVLDGTNPSAKATTQPKDTDAFAAGDELYVVVTTDAGWLPITADIRVFVEVET